MKNDQKKRLQILLTKVGIVLGVGAVYALFVSLTGWGIPCIFHLLTGKYCPGCGISRMCLALLRLDFVSAARYNLLVFCLLPFGLALFVYKAWRYVQTGENRMGTGEKIFYMIAFVLCVTFFILRNTELIPFLRMEGL